MSVSRRSLLLAGAVLPLSALPAAAQTPARPGGSQPQSGGATPTAGEDPLLAACMLIGGRKQIENCTYAKDKLTTDDAKKFAQAEIDEHMKNKADLKKLGYDYPVLPAARGAAEPKPTDPPKPSDPPRPADANNPVTVSVGGGRQLPVEAAALLAVDHEVADQCIVNYRKEMGQLSGLKLDKRFVGHQLDEHMALKDKVQTYRRHASKEMQPVLDDGLKVIETHIATCKELMQKLDGMKDGDK